MKNTVKKNAGTITIGCATVVVDGSGDVVGTSCSAVASLIKKLFTRSGRKVAVAAH